MTGVNNDLNRVGTIYDNTQIGSDLNVGSKVSGGNIPEAVLQTVSDLLSETPRLRNPNTQGMSNTSIMGMDEDTIMQMLGTENANAIKKTTIESIKAKASMRKSQNEQVLANLQEQYDKMEKQSFWDKLVKGLKIFAAIIGVVAGVAGAVFSGGSSLALAAAVVGTLMALESGVSAATDGKVGLGAACTAIFGEELGPKIAMGITIAAALFSLGAGIGGSLGKAAENVTKLATVVKISTNVTSGVTSIGSGVAAMGSAMNRYSLENLKADQKELEKVMAMIQALIEQDTKHLEQVLDQSNAMVEGVKEIIQAGEAATTAVVTA
jgi:hypothetical protein